jgi:hypothetical protein
VMIQFLPLIYVAFQTIVIPLPQFDRDART